MGCDIHGMVQMQEHGGWWDILRLEMPGRDYSLFSCLAGVRGSEDHVPPRGAPEDFACWHEGECVESDCFECPHAPDSHTPTWLTASEFHEALERRAGLLMMGVGVGWVAVGRALEALGEQGRIVLWFDN